MDYLVLDAVCWLYGVMPKVVVQTDLSCPNADHHSRQARGGAAALLLTSNPIAT